MADPAIVINLATEFTGKKAFTTADKATQKLSKSVKKLAGAFGLAFGTTAIIAFGKSAVKAFIEDDNAARSLGITLKNLGLEFGNTAVGVNDFISNLEKQTGVLDDELRPAMDRLLRATFSVRQSQKLLALALDISAGTGKDLTAVSQGLQKAFLGNTASLSKLGVGLSKAELTASSFDQIVVKLSTLFAGQASSAAESYAGQLNKLTVAGNNAKEVIGKGIIQALTESSGQKGFGGATEAIENYAEKVSKAIVNISRFITLAKEIPSFLDILKNPFGAGSAFDKYNAAFDRLEALQKNDILSKQFGQASGMSRLNEFKARQKAEAAALGQSKKAAAAAAAAKAAADKKKALADKKAEALSKAAAAFDLTKISIAAALRATFDADTKLRLLAMQAIENDQGEAALKYLEQLGILQKAVQTDKLAGITTIGNASLASLNATLLAELAAIDKTKMSEDDKNKARNEAFAKYNDAITKQGGLAAANSYAELTQIQLVSIAKLAALQGYGAALATLNTIMTSNEKAIALTQSANDLARYMALQDYIKLLGVAYNAAIALAQASAGKAVPGGIVIPGTGGAVIPGAGPGGNPFVPGAGGSPFLPNPIFPGAGSSKDEKEEAAAAAAAAAAAIPSVAAAIGEIAGAAAAITDIVVPHAAIAAAASEDAANAIAAIANNTDPTMIDYAAIYAAMESTARDDRGRSADNITVNINAGVIADPDAFVAIVQDAIQVNNRRGNNLEVAGII